MHLSFIYVNTLMQKVLCFHEMHDKMQIPTDCIATFDDGLYTQYKHGKNLPNLEKIFFISTKFICSGTQSTKFIRCEDAHKKAFAGNYENYMTKEQILELLESGCMIGGHSHSHTNLNNFSTLREKIDHIKQDTEQMLEWFETNLHFKPLRFCFPYNDDADAIYTSILRNQYGFSHFYGKERITLDEIPAETLQHV